MRNDEQQRLTKLFAIFHGGRMLVGTINIVFLLQTGLSIEYVALLQTIFTITTIIIEFPSGILGDKYGHKFCVILGCVFVILYYFLYMFSPNIIMLILAQICYASSLAFVSGSLEAWITNSGNSNENSKIVSYRNELRTISVLFFSIIGTIVVYFTGENYRIVFLIAMVLFTILLLSFLKIKSFNVNFKEKNKFMNVFKESCKNSNFIYFVICTMLLTSGSQIINLYWQPMFKLIDENTNKIFEKNIEVLNEIVFFSFISVTYILMIILRKILPKLNKNFLVLKLSVVVCIVCSFLFGGSIINNLWINIIIFSIWQGALIFVEVILQIEILNNIDNNVIASTLSAGSSLGNVFSVFVLYYVSQHMTEQNILIFYRYTIIFFVPLFLVILLWNRALKSK